jgi:hypothetical protein
MSGKIRIIGVPPGQAPVEIRQAWVGLELPVIEGEVTQNIPIGVFGGPAENSGGYRVDGQKAIELLGQKSPTAAEWWKQNAPWALLRPLLFAKEVCEEI